MSQYIPDRDGLRTEHDESGWWVCDPYGRIDGPYETDAIARATFPTEANDVDEPGSDCAHEWEYTGTAYGGDDPRWHGEGRCFCIHCGADGDG